MTYAFLAAHTKRLRFGTGVLVLPMRRDIVVTAKQIATLDHLSNGRAEIGVGVGAYREEFEALNPGTQVHRGDMVEEGVKALQLLFSERNASFDGKYYQFKDVELYPKPKQKRLPIYFGGNSANHLRRTAKSADGWIPAGLPLGTLRRMVGELKQMTEEAGRNFADIQVSPAVCLRLGRDRGKAVTSYQRSQIYKHFEVLEKVDAKGPALDQVRRHRPHRQLPTVIDRANAFRDAGVTHFLGLSSPQTAYRSFSTKCRCLRKRFGQTSDDKSALNPSHFARARVDRHRTALAG